MSAEIYVGKNASITLQIPVKDEYETLKLTDLYDYYGIQNGSSTHAAYDQEASSEPAPNDSGWTELTNDEYGNIGKSDDTRHSVSTSANGNYALMLFRFLCGIAEADAKKIVLTFEGYGEGTPGNGATIKVWNHVSSAWEQAQSGTGSGDEELVITLTSNIANYIDDNGFIYLLARTTNADDGTNHMTLYCDYVKCFVTQAKFTVDHTPISDRDMDGVADEPAHVTVTVNGVEVTVQSVDDDTGLVTLASGDFDEGDIVYCSYRYDSKPYVAQEVSLEPSIEVEGIDGLGSDEIQLWALTKKEFKGSIREVFHNRSQLNRIKAHQRILFDNFNYASEEDDPYWTFGERASIVDGAVKFKTGTQTAGASIILKNPPQDALVRGKFNIVGQYSDNYLGITFRSPYCLRIRDDYIRLSKYKSGWIDLDVKGCNLSRNTWYYFELEFEGSNFRARIWGNGIDPIELEGSDSEFKTGSFSIGIVQVYSEAWVDDVYIEAPPHLAREDYGICLLYTSPSPRDLSTSRMPSSA